MKRIIITLALLLGLNLSAQEKKTYQLQDGSVRVEQFYPNGTLSQVSFYYQGEGIRTWLKYNEVGQITTKAEMENGRPVKITHFVNGNTIVVDRRKN